MVAKPSYKQTEVGVTPNAWEVEPLSELGKWKGGMTPSMRNPDFWVNGTVPWISSGDVKSVQLKETAYYITSEAVKQGTTTMLPAGSIVLVTRSGILRKYLPVATNLIPMAINQDIKALIPEEGISSSFVLHALIHAGPRILSRCLKAGTTVESVEFKWLKAFTILLPPHSEQRAIAKALSDVDALLVGLDRLIAKNRELKQAAMQQLLTCRTRLPGFHGEWEVKRLGEIGKFRNGINKAKEDFGHGYPFVNLIDVFGVAKLSNSNSFGLVNSTSAERELYELRKGDVLFVRSSVKPAGVGLTTLTQEDLSNTVFSGFLLRFRDEGALTTEYKEHCFFEAGFRKRLISSSTVSANTNINQVSLRALTLKFPRDKAEQTAIAEVLTDMDAELAALEQRRKKSRALKQAMMQELLTGRTRLISHEEVHA